VIHIRDVVVTPREFENPTQGCYALGGCNRDTHGSRIQHSDEVTVNIIPWRRPLAAIALLVPALAGAQMKADWQALERPRAHDPQPTTSAITPQDLRTRLYQFADDSMGGRLIGSIGNGKGVAYIARELARLGFEPAGENGTFFQTLPIVQRGIDPQASVSVGDDKLTLWTDFVPRDQGPGQRSIDGVQAIYGGTWGDSTSLIAPDAAAGKLVVLGVTPEASAAAGGTPGTANRFQVSSYFPLAAGIAIAGLDLVPAPALGIFKQSSRGMRPPENTAVPSYMYVTSRVAALLLGSALAEATRGQTGRTVRATATVVESPAALDAPARNVVAILRGADPRLRGEFVALGAHNDHVGTSARPVAHDSIYVLNHLFRQQGADSPPAKPSAADYQTINGALAEIRRRTDGQSARPDSIFNGADDDGSGSMGLLEVAEYYAGQKTRPKRSLLFVWHVGEEVGLWGSAYYTDHPTVARDSIVAQLNMDMIGRGAADDVTGSTKDGREIMGDANYVQLVGSRRLSTELGDLAEAVNTGAKKPLHFDYALDANGHPQNIYCRSDHYEYARYGIPIIFFTTGGHADYHQVTDEPQYIDYDRLARVSQFVADLAHRVGDLDHRVVVDKPKPDPNGNCVQ
jgi:hypothetical protein